MSELKKFLNNVPVNVESLIRSWGISLEEVNFPNPETLGKIAKQPDGSYKISIKKDDYPNRKRFTMAHEFAHFYLHNKKIGVDGIDDFIEKDNRSVMYRSTNANVARDDEVEANKFAASLLMPEDLVVQYAKERGAFNNDGQIDQGALQEIATAFQVSKTVMEIRINGLKDKISTN